MQVFGKTLAALALTLAVTGTCAEDGDFSGEGRFSDSNSVSDGTEVTRVYIYEDNGRVVGVGIIWDPLKLPVFHGESPGHAQSLQLSGDEYIIGGEISVVRQDIVYLELHTNKPGNSVAVGRKDPTATIPFSQPRNTDQIVGFEGYVGDGILRELNVIWKCKTRDCT